MPDMVTLRDLVNTFTEQELDMTIPMDFKNPTAETIEYANHYNELLAAGNWQAAYEYRVANANILEPMIHDAKALNRQQAMMINTYLFAKGEKTAENTSYNNARTGVNVDTVQLMLDMLYGQNNTLSIQHDTLSNNVSNLSSQLGGYTIKKVSSLPENPNNNTIYLVTG